MEGRDAVTCKSSQHQKTQHVILGTTREGRTQWSKWSYAYISAVVGVKRSNLQGINKSNMATNPCRVVQK